MFADIDGVRTPRPPKQDIKPRAFKGNPEPIAMIAFAEPTDRYVLWFIRHYPYAYNIFFVSDFANWLSKPEGDISKWPLYKHQIVVKSLRDRHLIRYGDKKRLTLKITLKGTIYRVYTHASFNFWVVVIGIALAALAIFKDDIFSGKGHNTNISDSTTRQKK